MAFLSLVAYEDSDSDEESGTNNEGVSFTLKCDSAVEQFLGSPGSSATGLPEDRQCTNTTSVGPLWPFKSPPWQQPQLVDSCKTALQIPPHSLPQNPACPNPVKRLAPSSAGVRPYIPKRQKLAPTDDRVSPGPSVRGGPVKGTSTNTTTSQASGSRMLSEVSERVRPFLGQKVGRMELPRRCHLQLQAHQGPVNTVQWCPAPHTSHLLLSASMDRTVKVRSVIAGTDLVV